MRDRLRLPEKQQEIHICRAQLSEVSGLWFSSHLHSAISQSQWSYPPYRYIYDYYIIGIDKRYSIVILIDLEKINFRIG